MKIIWRRKVLKALILLCLLAIIPYILIISLEKTKVKQGDGNRMFMSFIANGKGHQPVPAHVDKQSLYEEGKASPKEKDETPARPHDVPMMAKYCNPPSKPVTGTEGKVAKGYRLALVHVFIRHGDRTSIHELHGYESVEVSCNFDTWYNGSDYKVRQFAKTMATLAGKQPGRNHFLNWSLYPKKEHCHSSELTSQGALQHILNGMFLQERYINQSELFDTRLALSSQIYVRSTEVSRTYQSAVALLYGLVPNMRAVHLNIDNSNSLFFCRPNKAFKTDCYCKHANDLNHHAKLFKNHVRWNRTAYHNVKSQLADIFDNGIEQTPWVTAVLDTFAPALCHQLPTPCSVSNPNRCINGSLVKLMWDEAIVVDGSQNVDPNKYYLKYASLMLHPVMVELVHRINDVIEGRPSERFVLYSGHDLTLSPLLMVLGLYDGVWPPYASRLVIELYRQETSGVYMLRFVYNGVDRTTDVVFCKGNTIDGLCEYYLFRDFVFKKMIDRFFYKSYRDACSRTKV